MNYAYFQTQSAAVCARTMVEVDHVDVHLGILPRRTYAFCYTST